MQRTIFLTNYERVEINRRRMHCAIVCAGCFAVGVMLGTLL